MHTKGTLLIVDDNENIKNLLQGFFASMGYFVLSASDANEGLKKLRQIMVDLVITDVMMPGPSGIDFMKEVKTFAPDLPVVVITGYPSINTAVKVMREGASDFIVKPFNLDHAKLVVKRAVEEGRLRRENKALSDKMGDMDRVKRIARNLEDKVAELSTLYTINDILQKTMTTEELIDKVIELSMSATEAARATVWVVDRGEVVLKASRPNAPCSRDRVRIEDLGELRDLFSGRDMVLSMDPRSCLCMGESGISHPAFCVPIKISGEVFALLQLCQKTGWSEFTQKDVSIVRSMVDKASLRLENIALYKNLTDNVFQSISSLVSAIDARDNYTMSHCRRVTAYAVLVAKTLGCPNDVVESLKFAGPIHDVGKIGIRDDILLKPAPLSSEERVVMQSHVTIGDGIVGPLNLGAMERAIIRSHHEWFDGTGYPDGLKHDEIPIAARIFSAVDTYDAMTTRRPYRSPRTHDDAVEELLRFSGTQFDAEVVNALLRLDIGAEGIADYMDRIMA